VSVRAPGVAGAFYPADPRTLSAAVDALLANADPGDALAPKAIVAPHAGYVYSGPVAASAYAYVAARRELVTRVVLLGPAHRVALDGIAVPSVDAMRTPLGDVPIDRELRAAIAALPGVYVDDTPHRGEHSLEVHLPFLQRVLSSWTVLPLVVGHARDDDVATVLNTVWGGDETLVVVSTDLSHYEPHESATRHDRATADAILAGRADAIRPSDACGVHPVRGLLAAAASHGLRPQLLDLRTSAETAGSPDRVVGYGAFAWVAP